MCDFGISGYLEKSIAKTIDAGCKPYMAVRVLIYLIFQAFLVTVKYKIRQQMRGRHDLTFKKADNYGNLRS